MSLFFLIMIYITFISLGLPDALLGSAWPVVYRDIGAGATSAGAISMIVAGGTIISSLMTDRLIRRFGTGKLTAFSVFLTAAALAGCSVSPSFGWLCFFAVPLGLGAGAVDAGLNNFVALHYEARHMSWLHCFWGIGATGGPAIMAFFLARGNNWHGGYRAVSVIQFLLVIALVVTLPLWKHVEKRADLSEGETAAVRPKNPLSLPMAKTAMVGFFCYCGLEALTGLWGASYLVSVKMVAAGTAAGLSGMFYLGITAGRFLSGFATMKLSNPALIRLGEWLILIGIGAVVVLPGEAAAAGLFLIGLGCAPIYPCMLHETPNRFGSEISQAVMGFQMACAYVGSTFCPPLTGLLARFLDIRVMIPVSLVLLVFTIISSERVNRRMKQIQQL